MYITGTKVKKQKSNSSIEQLKKIVCRREKYKLMLEQFIWNKNKGQMDKQNKKPTDIKQTGNF